MSRKNKDRNNWGFVDDTEQPDVNSGYEEDDLDDQPIEEEIDQWASEDEDMSQPWEDGQEYEEDYPYPSCLVYGITIDNQVIHVVCGVNEVEVWIITAYYPDDIKWKDDLKTRKEKK